MVSRKWAVPEFELDARITQIRQRGAVEAVIDPPTEAETELGKICLEKEALRAKIKNAAQKAQRRAVGVKNRPWSERVEANAKVMRARQERLFLQNELRQAKDREKRLRRDLVPKKRIQPYVEPTTTHRRTGIALPGAVWG